MSLQNMLTSLLVFLPIVVPLATPRSFLPFKKFGPRSDRQISPRASSIQQNIPRLWPSIVPLTQTTATPRQPRNLMPGGFLHYHQLHNVSFLSNEYILRDSILSNRFDHQLLGSHIKNELQPMHILSDTIAHNTGQNYFRAPRKSVIFRHPMSSVAQSSGISPAQRDRSYPNRATDNPYLLRHYLSMLRRRYHRQIISRIIPRSNRKIPPVTLYWNSQNLPKNLRRSTHKRQNKPPRYNNYPRPYVFHRVYSKQKPQPRYRPRPQERLTRNINLPHRVYTDADKSKRHRKKTVHSQHQMTSPNLYRYRQGGSFPTSYRDFYLQNSRRQRSDLRWARNNHLERTNTERMRHQMFYPVQKDRHRRISTQLPQSPRQPMSYREKYLQMLREKQVDAELKISNSHLIKNPPLIPRRIPLFPVPRSQQRRERQRPTDTQRKRIRPLRKKPRHYINRTERENTHYANHPRQRNHRNSFEKHFKRPLKYEGQTPHETKSLWPSKLFNLNHPNPNNETQHQLRTLLKNIDWQIIENNCWHYNGLNKHSRWCQYLRTPQRQTSTTGRPPVWSTVPSQTTTSPWTVSPLTTAPRPDLYVTRQTPSSLQLTTTISAPPVGSTVPILDREVKTINPGLKEWLNERCGITSSPFIIGGRNSREGRWAWQVSLQIVTSLLPWHRCGGVLIHPRWVLTAAHCMEGPFYGDTSNWRVVLADHNLDVISGDEVYRTITRIISHPGYVQTSNFPNDVALLELDSPVDITSGHIQVACLPDINFDLSPGTECWISGWGETRGSGGHEGQMNELSLKIMDTGQCRAMWDRVDIAVLDTQVCLGDGLTGACFGDSGGPLMCERDGRVFVAGVMSWLVRNCSGPDFPNVFTRLPSYLPWLDQQLDFYQAGWSS